MSLVASAPESSVALAIEHRGGVTWRSVLLGTMALIAFCTLTPINDYIFSNTSLVVGFLPLAMVLVLFVLVVLVNAPLLRWFPRYALSSSELAVVVLMSFIACSIANWGVMRFFIPAPVAPFHLGTVDETYWNAFLKMDLPRWLFPVDDLAGGKNNDAVKWFYVSVPEGE